MLKFKRFLIVLVIVLAFNSVTTVYAEETKKYYIGGFPIGIEIKTEGAYVIQLNELVTSSGVYSPAEKSGIRVGDVILSVNGIKTNDRNDIVTSLKEYVNGDEVIIEIMRDGEKIIKQIYPVLDVDGAYKLGITIKEDLTGIGTVTYIDENDEFCSLGHPVIDYGNSAVKMISGNAYVCSVYGITKGERGKAGELKGIIVEDKKTGKLTINNQTGLYGKFYENYKNNEVEIGKGKIGKASIYTCIDGNEVCEYSVNIVKVDKNSDNKDFVIKITDKALLEKTGGILQGMSGSPIIQNGKLIGAVTHVFINDPTRGYGISIDKML